MNRIDELNKLEISSIDTGLGDATQLAALATGNKRNSILYASGDFFSTGPTNHYIDLPL